MTRRRLFDFRNKKKGGSGTFWTHFQKTGPNDPKFDQKLKKRPKRPKIWPKSDKNDPKSGHFGPKKYQNLPQTPHKVQKQVQKTTQIWPKIDKKTPGGPKKPETEFDEKSPKKGQKRPKFDQKVDEKEPPSGKNDRNLTKTHQIDKNDRIWQNERRVPPPNFDQKVTKTTQKVSKTTQKVTISDPQKYPKPAGNPA